MKTISTTIFMFALATSFGQTWTKVSGIMDNSQIKGIAQIDNKILVAGQNWDNNTVTDYAVSTDGNSWTSLPTYSFAGYLPNSLPQNNLLLCSNGFTSTSSLNGSTWQTFSTANNFAEFSNGNIIGTIGSYPDTIYHFSNTGVKGAKLGNYTFKFGSKYCAAANNRVFVFAYGVGLGYIDYSNLGMVNIPATLDGSPMTQTLWDLKFITDMKKASNGNLFAIGDGLFKSTDNGENWTRIQYFSGTPIASIAISSLDEIYILRGNAEVQKSTDLGVSFVNISGNLPSPGDGAFKTHLFTNAANEVFVCLNKNGGPVTGTNSGIFKLTNLASIDENSQGSFQIYPNPASSEVTIELSSFDTNSKIVVINTDGRIVYANKINSHATLLNVESFTKGIYFVSITSDNKTNTQKLIIK